MKDKDPGQPLPSEKKQKKDEKSRGDFKWVGTVFCITIVISACFSFLSDLFLDRVAQAGAFVILFIIVAIGIVFDIIGVAVTTADEKPFHAMAAKNIPEARQAIRLIRNASRVSSFCNDVVGDICGIISGSAAAIIAARVIINFTPTFGTFFRLIMSAVVSGVTVGGKALGKKFAINSSTAIVQTVSKIIYCVCHFPTWLRSRRAAKGSSKK